MPQLILQSLRGGMNDADPPIALPDDQVVLAQNVETFRSTCGERRRGAAAIDLTLSPLSICDRIVWEHRHLPTTNAKESQYWALGISGSTAILAYKDTSWNTVTIDDPVVVDGVSEYRIQGQTLHGKLFLAYNNVADRLHVWDGTTFRRVGIAAPANPPTVANSGSGGTFSGTRYYRFRWSRQVGGVTVLRSEPSAVVTHTPSGTPTGATITLPTTTGEDSHLTHGEIEASLNNADWYRIATIAIATGSYTDTSAATTGYASDGVLSEDIGAYEVPHCAVYLMADEDRLLMFGCHIDPELASAVSWTPVYNATGVGNDERVPLDPVSTLNLDGYEGGPITARGRIDAGEIGIFKDYHTYRLIRTGIRTRAYEAFAVSKTLGAIEGSVVEGPDERGNPVLYFLDASAGPHRAGRRGIQRNGRDIWTTWQTVNLDASKAVARGLYYPPNQQVLYCVATGSSDVPNYGLTLQTNEQRETEGGEVRRGWSVRTGPSTGALSMVLYADNLDAGTDRSLTLVPYIGVEGSGLIWQLDTGDDDNGTEYQALQRTKPYTPTGLQNQFEVRNGSLVAKATEDALVVVTLTPDFGLSPSKTAETVSLDPENGEAHVVRAMDDLSLAECQTVQVEIADPETPGPRWELSRVSLNYTTGQRA